MYCLAELRVLPLLPNWYCLHLETCHYFSSEGKAYILINITRCYLEGGPEFRVVTDHKAITYLDTVAQLSRRQTRWAEFLSRFHFTWEHMAGASNVVADALSRTPVGYTPPNSLVNVVVVSTRSYVSEGPPCLPNRSLRDVICAVTRAQGIPLCCRGSWYGTRV
jgi:hypothetical protein